MNIFESKFLTAFVLGAKPTLVRTRFNILPSSVAVCFALLAPSTTPVEQSRHCSLAAIAPVTTKTLCVDL